MEAVIEATKKRKLASDVHSCTGHRALSHLELLAASGIGALLGVAFLVLTLVGLPVLAWMLLGLTMTGALAHIGLVAAGRSGLLNVGAGGRDQRDGDRQQLMTDEGG
jgi:hypothetical protein